MPQTNSEPRLGRGGVSRCPIIHRVVSITSKPEWSEPTAGVYEPWGKGSVLPVDTVVMDPL